MTKVKIFTANHEYILEKSINEFISNKDILYTTSYFNSFTGERNVIIFIKEDK